MLYFLLALLCSSAFALNCFSASSINQNYQPAVNESILCNVYVTQCFKGVVSAKDQGNKIKGVIYGCSDYKQVYNGGVGDVCHGVDNGKCVKTGGTNFCCCSGNLCNSTRGKMIIFAPIVALSAGCTHCDLQGVENDTTTKYSFPFFLSQMTAEQANEDYQKFDPDVYYEQYYRTAEGPYAQITYPIFPKLIRSMEGFPKKVKNVLDLGTGPIIIGCVVLRDIAESFYVSDYCSQNREALRKWILKEKLPYDFNYICGIIKETEGSAESVDLMQDRTREKIQAILDVNIFDDEVIKNSHWKRENAVDVPKKFGIVMSHFCLTNVCQTQEGFEQAVKRTVDLIEDGGYLILAGFLKFPEYAVGDVLYQELSHTLEDICSALKKSGMSTSSGKGFEISEVLYRPEETMKDYDYHELHGEYCLAGFLSFTGFTMAGVEYKKVGHTLEDILTALKKAGMATEGSGFVLEHVKYQPENYQELESEIFLISRKMDHSSQ